MITMLVAGGRNVTDGYYVQYHLEQVSLRYKDHAIRLIHGGAKGVDTHADRWARLHGYEVKVFHADWERLGKAAGPVRNEQMIKEGKPDVVVIFPGGRGTANMRRQAEEAGLQVIVIESTDEALQ